MSNPASPPPPSSSAKGPPPDRLIMRTFQSIVQNKQFTVRQMCGKLRLAAESLRASYVEPGRLTLNAVMAFSEMIGEPPEKLVSDLFAEIRERRKTDPVPDSPKRARSRKPAAVA